MDENLVPSASRGESKVFYCKMKGDDYRHLAELATRDAKSKAAEDARVAYAEATKGQKTVEVPQVQKVVGQGQVPTIQTVQKAVEVPQVQILDRVVDVPVAMQRQVPVPQTMEEIMEVIQLMPQERTPECIVEETIDIPIPRMTEETIQGVKPIPQERVQNDAVEHIVDVPVPWIREETGQVTQLIPQDRISDCNVEQTVDNHVWQIQEQTVEVMKVTPKERVQPHRRVFVMDDCDELIPEWLNFVKGVVDSEDLPLNISRETLQQNKILRVIKKNHVMKCLDMFAEIAEQKDDYKKFYEQFGKCLKLGIHEDSTNRTEIAESLRLNTSKSADEQISLKEHVDRMKQGDVQTSTVLETLRTKGHEVLHVVDLADELAMQQPKEFDGKGLKSATKDRFDLGDGDDELKAESGLEDWPVVTKFKFETGHGEETGKALQDARNQLDKNRLSGNDGSDMVIDMPAAAQHRHEVMQRQVLSIQRVQGA